MRKGKLYHHQPHTINHNMTNIIPVSAPEDDQYHRSDADNNNNPNGINYNDSISNTNYVSSGSVLRRVLKCTIFLAAIFFGCFVLRSSFSPPFLISLQLPSYGVSQVASEPQNLESILRNASMKDGNNTVILTILNEAWAERNSIFDLFVESFRIGEGTERLLNHLVPICMDDKAYELCSASHPHCYRLRTKGVDFAKEAFFMSPTYLELVWRKIDFLGEVLELGYSFIFTDTDIMWLRDPFPRFSPEADFQISCDRFNGNTSDLRNLPNSGFQYVKSNPRTIKFYRFWFFSRLTYPGFKTQDVFNKIKFDPFLNQIGLRIRFLKSDYFGGFCQPSKDLNLVSTMHANCCIGIKNKINDLTLLLDDWKRFNSSSQPALNRGSPWSVPKYCRKSMEILLRQKSKQNR